MLNKCYVCFVALSIMCLASQPAASLTITENEVIKLVKAQSFGYQEIQNRTLVAEFNYQALNGAYRLNLNFDYSLESDDTESLTTSVSPDADKTKKTLLLNKRFSTGTLTGIELTQVDYKSNATEYTQNYYTLSLEQNLFPYIFSSGEAYALKAARLDIERTNLQTEIDLLDHIKEVLTLFWKVRASQKSVQENEDLLKKYEKLVANVKSKRQNSYASAGEVEQALAEYETRKQTLLEDKNTLLTNLQLLKTALNVNPEEDLHIANTVSIPKPLPEKFSGEIKNTRKYKAQQLKTNVAVNNNSAVYWKTAPKLSVYGKYTAQGLNADHDESWNDLQDDPSNKYIIGLKLDYFFDDQAAKSEKQLKNAIQNVEVSRLLRYEDDLKLQIQNTRQKLENAYANLQTTQNVLKYRTEAVKQLNVTYGQGRTDINFLIDAFNKKIAAEVAVINAQGNYSTALIEYQNLVE